MKRLKCFAMACAGMLAFQWTIVALPEPAAVYAEEFMYNGMIYTVNEGKVTITRFSKNLPSELVIPDVIDGNPVTSIGDSAFEFRTGLTSITIPNRVTSIGDYAFSLCTDLTSVTIPDSVTSIGYGAFHGCTGLISITIPNSWTSIGYDAFYRCAGLTSITIPDSVTSIGNNAINNCTGLTIKGYAGSYAETYADLNSIPFVALEEQTATTATTTSTTTTTTTTETTVTQNSGSDSRETNTAPPKKTYASPSRFEEMSKKDYKVKNGVMPENSRFTDNGDGTYSIVLSDKDGNVLDTYTLDAATGIGTDSKGNEVNLPQTGNNSVGAVAAVSAASILMFAGMALAAYSRVCHRKKEEE